MVALDINGRRGLGRRRLVSHGHAAQRVAVGSREAIHQRREWGCAMSSTVQCCRLVEGRESVADIERARVAEIKDFPTSHLLCLLVSASFGAGGSSRCLRQPRTRTRTLPPFLRTLPSFSINNSTNLSFRPSSCSRDFSAQLDSQATVEYR